MGQPSFITTPSYDMLHTAALTMVKASRALGWIDAIVAPVRGGLMFGVIASHKLNVPLIAVPYSSKSGNGDDKGHTNIIPDLSKYKTILLVDDIMDSGNTMAELVTAFTAQHIKVITAVFHYKEDAKFQPDVYFWRIPADSEFITFPYEVV